MRCPARSLLPCRHAACCRLPLERRLRGCEERSAHARALHGARLLKGAAPHVPAPCSFRCTRIVAASSAHRHARDPHATPPAAHASRLLLLPPSTPPPAVDETLRLLKAFKFTDEHGEVGRAPSACGGRPASWPALEGTCTLLKPRTCRPLIGCGLTGAVLRCRLHLRRSGQRPFLAAPAGVPRQLAGGQRDHQAQPEGEHGVLHAAVTAAAGRLLPQPASTSVLIASLLLCASPSVALPVNRYSISLQS